MTTPPLAKEKADYVKAQLTGVICASCGATLATYAYRCTASLASQCEGYNTIEKTMQDFDAMVSK